MTDPGGEQQRHVSVKIDVSGYTPDDLDKAIAESEADPVRSSILKAARATLTGSGADEDISGYMTNPSAATGIGVGTHWDFAHTDSHWDWTGIHVIR